MHIDEKTIKATLMELNEYKAPGLGTIHPKVLQELAEELIKWTINYPLQSFDSICDSTSELYLGVGKMLLCPSSVKTESKQNQVTTGLWA